MPSLPDPIKEKVKILYELGMTDSEAVKAHLIKETINITNPLKMEMKLDRVAHSMIMNFFDGDKQFVDESKEEKEEKENENEILGHSYAKAPFAYCKLKQCNLTVKQIKKEGCLKKQCWHLVKICSPFIKSK